MKRLAIDTGGTFTDIVYVDDETMQMKVDKVKSTPEDPGKAVIEGMKKIGANMADITLFIHGTTASLNTLIQKKGSKVGLISTKGFADVLEMGRADRKELYNYLWKKPKPLVPRNLSLGLSERTNYLGQILEKVNEEELKEIVKIFKDAGVEVIAVSLLHSYANPENEQKVEEIINKLWPEVTVSLSHQIAREFREYERTSTTVLDSYIKNSVVAYLEHLKNNLDSMGFAGQTLIVTPSGVLGITSIKKKAIATLTSGPVGGATGAAFLAKTLNRKNLVCIDVGGTSFDVSLIKDGMNLEKYEQDFIGYPALIPGVDVRSIGAGGGSIARVNSGGLLTVGPDSAGASPGPMCYGNGGTEPTVTDAALVSGWINPDCFVGGEFQVDMNLAKSGIEQLAGKLGLSLNATAFGILKIATNSMTTLTEEILIGQGYDPRDFAIFSYGGAGGLFATSIAREIGISTVIVPVDPGVFSAWGMMEMNIAHSYAQTHFRLLEELDIRELENIYQEMEHTGQEMLKEEGIQKDAIEFVRSLDMSYEGQGHYVEVPLSNLKLEEGAKAEISNIFHRFHETKYGHTLNAPQRITTVRLKAIGKIKDVRLSKIQSGEKVPDEAYKAKRKIYLDKGFEECQIYDRTKLLSGNVIKGPAIVEEPFHTTVVLPDQTVHIDDTGNLIINIGGK
jgi:N-methylhydantoinase A